MVFFGEFPTLLLLVLRTYMSVLHLDGTRHSCNNYVVLSWIIKVINHFVQHYVIRNLC